MKLITTIIICLVYNLTFGQQLLFKGEIVDSIHIRAHQSVYKFDKKGTTKGKESNFSIAYNDATQRYIVNRYYQDKVKVTLDPKSFRIRTSKLKIKSKKKVGSVDINNLLTSLNENLDSNLLITQIDTLTFLNYINEYNIRKIAKKHGIDWYFTKKYSSKIENEMFYKSCRSVDSLKVYFTESFQTEGYVVITDVASNFIIKIVTSNSKYYFEGKYPNPVKQPWYDFSDTGKYLPTTILNLDINKYLRIILPRDFFTIDRISDEALYDDYIKWYLKKRKKLI